jgi:hypothetical protein
MPQASIQCSICATSEGSSLSITRRWLLPSGSGAVRHLPAPGIQRANRLRTTFVVVNGAMRLHEGAPEIVREAIAGQFINRLWPARIGLNETLHQAQDVDRSPSLYRAVKRRDAVLMRYACRTSKNAPRSRASGVRAERNWRSLICAKTWQFWRTGLAERVALSATSHVIHR